MQVSVIFNLFWTWTTFMWDHYYTKYTSVLINTNSE